MRRMLLGVAVLGLGLTGTSATVNTQAQPLGFFITSVGSGNGGNLGGLAGADAHCQALAKAAGAGDRTWRAYLSAKAANGQAAVNAKDRIGSGPWYNAKGVMVARDVADLHSDNNKLGKENSLTEKGATVNGRGDTPNTHDILTGFEPRRHAGDRRARHHLRELDERGRRRQRAARPSRPSGRRGQPDVMELGAPLQGLQPGQSRGHRRRRRLLLLRREVVPCAVPLPSSDCCSCSRAPSRPRAPNPRPRPARSSTVTTT